MNTDTFTYPNRLTDTHRYTQTHRPPSYSHTDTQTHRHTDTQTHRHTDTQTHRHTDAQTHMHGQTSRDIGPEPRTVPCTRGPRGRLLPVLQVALSSHICGHWLSLASLVSVRYILFPPAKHEQVLGNSCAHTAHGISLHSTAQHYTQSDTQHCTTQHYTHDTALHSTTHTTLHYTALHTRHSRSERRRPHQLGPLPHAVGHGDAGM